MHEANVPAGAIVTKEGGPGDGFFLIDDAQVSLHGVPRGVMTAGDYFGEIALLMGSDRTATVTATTDLRCYALTPWDFRTLVEANPSIAWRLSRWRHALPRSALQAYRELLPSERRGRVRFR